MTDEIENSVAATLGSRIKALRKQSGLTLEQLGERCGVSRAMISSIERGEKMPTLPVVLRIASGFGIPVSDLLGVRATDTQVAVVRSSERLAYRDPETGFERFVVSPPHVRSDIEIVMHRLPPHQTTCVLPPYKTPAEKYVMVFEGTLTVYLEEKVIQLGVGDSMHFELKAPYRFANEGDLPCAYYLVITR